MVSADMQLNLFGEEEPPRTLAELNRRIDELELAYDHLLAQYRGAVVWDQGEERWYPNGFDPHHAGIAQRLNQLTALQNELRLRGVVAGEHDCAQ